MIRIWDDDIVECFDYDGENYHVNDVVKVSIAHHDAPRVNVQSILTGRRFEIDYGNGNDIYYRVVDYNKTLWVLLYS